MATYDKTKFYYLILYENFFDRDEIKWLESQDNGREYAYLYLKLCSLSLKNNGVIIQKVGNMPIPYDHKTLADELHFSVDTIAVVMELFIRIGLIEILENGAIYIPNIEELIGSRSKSAIKKQQQIARRNYGKKEEKRWKIFHPY